MPVLLQGLLLRQPGVAWQQSGGWAHLSTEHTALNVDVTAEYCRACVLITALVRSAENAPKAG